eukprot:TRINITY_DN11606_c0_g1_i1.p1 TRINITY_DN11606_c0_g1~~TRINITY_DN11606_c0_g1_i1.p1  ORF type:complete len:441 (+),score=106.45 TRINITY_DN11606_c0_g1_i1:32-1324(+)
MSAPTPISAAGPVPTAPVLHKPAYSTTAATHVACANPRFPTLSKTTNVPLYALIEQHAGLEQRVDALMQEWFPTMEPHKPAMQFPTLFINPLFTTPTLIFTDEELQYLSAPMTQEATVVPGDIFPAASEIAAKKKAARRTKASAAAASAEATTSESIATRRSSIVRERRQYAAIEKSAFEEEDGDYSDSERVEYRPDEDEEDEDIDELEKRADKKHKNAGPKPKQCKAKAKKESKAQSKAQGNPISKVPSKPAKPKSQPKKQKLITTNHSDAVVPQSVVPAATAQDDDISTEIAADLNAMCCAIKSDTSGSDEKLPSLAKAAGKKVSRDRLNILFRETACAVGINPAILTWRTDTLDRLKLLFKTEMAFAATEQWSVRVSRLARAIATKIERSDVPLARRHNKLTGQYEIQAPDALKEILAAIRRAKKAM